MKSKIEESHDELSEPILEYVIKKQKKQW